MNLDTKKTLLAAVLVFVAAGFRLIEHPINATPIVAVMLFSAAIFKEWSWKIGVPVAALLISDTIIELKNGYGFHSSTWMVYGTFALIFTVGYFLLKKISVVKVLLASIASSTLFFLVTNFAFFYPEAAVPTPALGHYPHNLTGVLASYEAGLPFYKNMLVGDLIFSTVIFGAYYIISKAAFSTQEKMA